MVGLLDYVDPSTSGYGGILSTPQGGAFPADLPIDEAAAAQAARDAAAARLGKRGAARADWGAKGPDQLAAVDATAPAIAYAMGQGPAPFGSLAPVVGAPASDQPAFPAVVPQAAAAPAAPSPSPAVPLPAPRPITAPPRTIDDVTLPPTATPTQGQGNPVNAPAVPPSSLTGRLGQLLVDADAKIAPHTATLLALAGGLAGAPSWGTGISRGMTAAAAALPMDQKMAGQNATVSALMARGMPRDLAMVAATNPVALQQVLPQMFGAKQRKFTQIGEDMMGNKQFGFVDETSGKTYDMAGKEIGAGNPGTGGGVTIPNGPDGQPLRGQALMAHLEQNSPQVAAEIKAMINGDASATPRNVQKLAPLAHLVDDSFDEKTYPTRLALRKSYMGGGKDFQETQALNTVGGHMGRLADAAQALNNSNFKPINQIKNFFADTFTGSPDLVKFRNDLVTTQNELAKAYHGGHVSDSAFAAFNKSINEAQTPAEMKAAIGELAGLLQSKIEAKESAYRQGMANAPLPEDYRAINEEARHSFAKINDWASGMNRGGQAGAAPVRVSSPAEAARLPKGTHFIDPNGVERVVP